MVLLLPEYDANILYDEPEYTWDGYLPIMPADYSVDVVAGQPQQGQYVSSVQPSENTYVASVKA